ncbi:hypothetical protein BBAD15_g2108 [Beauveria bassiana D1-5]|uniref:Uncharacterized protein n=1 Tax=Beauveria bassiana D1-5 TaxID=1245745 RepID=A0A0A2WG67_BEABA|nr:hypothetical protein BBAD15_g2108 [Beauveria bassiana D1-5]
MYAAKIVYWASEGCQKKERWSGPGAWHYAGSIQDQISRCRAAPELIATYQVLQALQVEHSPLGNVRWHKRHPTQALVLYLPFSHHGPQAGFRRFDVEAKTRRQDLHAVAQTRAFFGRAPRLSELPFPAANVTDNGHVLGAVFLDGLHDEQLVCGQVQIHGEAQYG